MKAIIFDLDETILNRDLSLLSFLDDQYERFLHLWEHIEKEPFIQRFVELDERGNVWKDKVYAQLIEEYKLNASVDELLIDYTEQFPHFVIGFPRYKEVLVELKEQGFLLGMITNGKKGFQRENIQGLGIADIFDVITVSEEVGMKKPDKDIFEYTLAKLHVVPNEAIFIGDNPINDVEAAFNVGILGVWKRDHLIESYETRYVIDELDEIFDILHTLNY
ncbi:HAD family hydrolase [Viridibacillus sp. YIM B01967]|uniref:HAD family hydrolase n=1 Tax=Viridibacillus soli TaxID=2798301 RepID=A0ABS1H494_9BACL|nr:HAD family hydrolase [Viridibacillus soli]MBK3494239.1 HAD family hydrolase [Viridibacillus soli]